MAHFPTLVKIIASVIYWIRREDIEKSQAQFIVFTGTSGKTTTRYLVNHALKKLGYSSISPRAGYTNEIGIVLASLGICDVSFKKAKTWTSLFKSRLPQDSYVCIELGADFRNDIPWFLSRFNPKIVIATGIDKNPWLGNHVRITEQRKKLITKVPDDGAVILSPDSLIELPSRSLNSKVKVFTPESQKDSLLKTDISVLLNNKNTSLVYAGNLYSFRFPRSLFPPQINALSSTLAVVDLLGKLPDLKENFFESYTFPGERLEIIPLKPNSLIIADTYKAVPKCTEWFLGYARLVESKKKILVFSESQPSVHNPDQYYQHICRFLPIFSKVYFVGSDRIYKILETSYSSIEKIPSSKDFENLSKEIINKLENDTVVFLKGAQIYNLSAITRNLSRPR